MRKVLSPRQHCTPVATHLPHTKHKGMPQKESLLPLLTVSVVKKKVLLAYGDKKKALCRQVLVNKSFDLSRAPNYYPRSHNLSMPYVAILNAFSLNGVRGQRLIQELIERMYASALTWR